MKRTITFGYLFEALLGGTLVSMGYMIGFYLYIKEGFPGKQTGRRHLIYEKKPEKIL